jgi:hypothetical protein
VLAALGIIFSRLLAAEDIDSALAYGGDSGGAGGREFTNGAFGLD